MTDDEWDYRPGFRERVGNWVVDNPGTMLLGTVGVMVALIVLAVASDASQRAKFMAGCTVDRPEYECVAMWRSGNASVTAVPVIIPIR